MSAASNENSMPTQQLDATMMPEPGTVRHRIASAKRLVVKIGSSSLTDESGRVDPARIDTIADALEARMADDTDLIVVSSGAVASGMDPLDRKSTRLNSSHVSI